MSRSNVQELGAFLNELCGYPDRHVGGPGNRAANERFARAVKGLGFEVESTELPCVVWKHGSSWLRAASERVELSPGPYSNPWEGKARLAAVATVEELERGGLEGTVLLVHEELAREQLMPKNFAFYNPESHQRIVRALEAARPLAVVAATGQNPELAGGMYPFPLIEDGDFELPTAYVKDVEGARLLGRIGDEVEVRIDSSRSSATAPQVLARKRGAGAGRVVFFAHIDTKNGTPGALDNGSGVTTLFALAGLLADYRGPHTLEIVPLNGEDYYAVPGQMHWLAQNAGRFGDIVVGFNVDGAGFTGEKTAVSLYDCPKPVRAAVAKAMDRQGFIEGPQWPQGDHSLLVFNGVPAVAVTSENAFFISSTVAHTKRDTPDRVDPAILARVARFIADAVEGLGR